MQNITTADALGSKGKLKRITLWFKERSFLSKFSFFVLFLGVCAGIATYFSLTDETYGSPGRIILLLNIDLILLLALIITLSTRIIGLWRGRKDSVVASKLHIQLVFIFGLIAALPAVIMTVFSAGFFYFGVHTWFSDRVKTAIDEANLVARSYLEEHQENIRADASAMAGDLDREFQRIFTSPEGFRNYMRTQAYLRNINDALLIRQDQSVIANVSLDNEIIKYELNNSILETLAPGKSLIFSTPQSKVVNALVRFSQNDQIFLIVARNADPNVLSRVANTQSASEEYNVLADKSKDFQRSVALIFSTVALILILSAVWFGLLMARKLVRPIGRLVHATEKIREGDLSTRLSQNESAEEFHTLATAFNSMTNQLQKQRNDLIEANEKIDERARFTENVLAGVSSGVIGVNEKGVITLLNDIACKIFSIEPKNIIGKYLNNLSPEFDQALREHLTENNANKQSEIEIKTSDDKERVFLFRVAFDDTEHETGSCVITFDDITQLQQAQRQAAWSDVARRIAHEIKNPLTPIQLAAERLKRRYLKDIQENPEVFAQCTDTIVKHVEDIQNMVNEFSSFARMPVPRKTYFDLQKLCRECISLQRQARDDIQFDFENISSNNTLDFRIFADNHLLRQAITNLIQNAVDSITENSLQDQDPRVVVTVNIDKENVGIHIYDNGKGLPEGKDTKKLIEPYMTTREKGTGLGLAIVAKIAEDHQGHFEISSLSASEKEKYLFKTGVKASIFIKSGINNTSNEQSPKKKTTAS